MATIVPTLSPPEQHLSIITVPPALPQSSTPRSLRSVQGEFQLLLPAPEPQAHQSAYSAPYTIFPHHHLDAPCHPTHFQTPRERIPSDYKPLHQPTLDNSTSSRNTRAQAGVDTGEYLRRQLGLDDRIPVNLDALPDPEQGRRPKCTLPDLVKLAIYGSENKRLTLQGICTAIMRRFEFYGNQPKGAWKHSIRHNLSLNKVFRRTRRTVLDTDARGERGGFWVLDVSEGEGYKRDRKRTRKRIKMKEDESRSTRRKWQGVGEGHGKNTPHGSQPEGQSQDVELPTQPQNLPWYKPYETRGQRNTKRSKTRNEPPASQTTGTIAGNEWFRYPPMQPESSQESTTSLVPDYDSLYIPILSARLQPADDLMDPFANTFYHPPTSSFKTNFVPTSSIREQVDHSSTQSSPPRSLQLSYDLDYSHRHSSSASSNYAYTQLPPEVDIENIAEPAYNHWYDEYAQSRPSSQASPVTAKRRR